MAFNAVAGIAIAAVGAMAIYAIDVATFVVALACYAAVTIPERGTGQPDDHDTDVGGVAADGGTADPAG